MRYRASRTSEGVRAVGFLGMYSISSSWFGIFFKTWRTSCFPDLDFTCEKSILNSPPFRMYDLRLITRMCAFGSLTSPA